MRKLVYVVLFILLALPVFGLERSGHINILAVSESEDNMTRSGSKADLYLDIRDGEGRIFIETFPVSKFDTQISTRFAKDIACKFLDVDCSRYDFFYRIRADASIIGGPSAGGAIAVLTAALLDGEEPLQDVAITGTITSGGIIGPVGGVKEKIEAAHDAHMEQVLIPFGSIEELGNVTLNYTQFGEELGIDVLQVNTLAEALFAFTGKDYRKQTTPIEVDDGYVDVMAELASDLCSRTVRLRRDYEARRDRAHLNLSEHGIDLVEARTANATERSYEADSSGDHYSSASYCFGANVNYRYLTFYVQNISINATLDLIEKTQEEIDERQLELSALHIPTITDLQTFMVVSERLREAEEALDDTLNVINESSLRAYNMAYAIERLYSAYSWSTFFGTGGVPYDITSGALQNSCTIKLLEAEELLQYVTLYLPTIREDQERFLRSAKSDRDEGDYASCLFKASKAKAESAVILSSLGVEQEKLDQLIEQKLNVAQHVISEETAQDRFPIIGYSYFEYANSLREQNPQSALVYSEYALELSNLDIYFSQHGFRPQIEVKWEVILVFILGIALGLVLRPKHDKKNP